MGKNATIKRISRMIDLGFTLHPGIKCAKTPNIYTTFDKSLIVLSATSGSISIASFATVIGAPAVIASASFSFTFSITTEIVKNY